MAKANMKIGSECSPSYKNLRHYIATVTKLKETDIDQTISEEINVDVKTIERITSDYRIFKWGEAKNVASFFIKEYQNQNSLNPIIFREMIRSFLKASVESDRNAGANEEAVNKYMLDNFGTDEVPCNGSAVTACRQYSNLPIRRGTNTPIHQSIFDDIETGVTQKKIIFIGGFSGTGKSYSAAYYASYCLDDFSDIEAVIWNEDTNGNLTLNTIISNVLSTFEQENVGNMSISDKTSTVLRLFRTHKSILIIDNFESILHDEKNVIFDFLIK